MLKGSNSFSWVKNETNYGSTLSIECSLKGRLEWLWSWEILSSIKIPGPFQLHAWLMPECRIVGTVSSSLPKLGFFIIRGWIVIMLACTDWYVYFYFKIICYVWLNGLIWGQTEVVPGLIKFSINMRLH